MLHVDYYSDLLCVWAYVAQVRVDELRAQFAQRLQVVPRVFAVFGSVEDKISRQWQARGGYAGYAEHVQSVVARFGHVTLHTDTWAKVRPRSSLPSHLYICAAELAERRELMAAGSALRLAWRLREAFFAQGQDISQQRVLAEQVERLGLDGAVLQAEIASGDAFAQLNRQQQQAQQQQISVSPTLVFNENRQRLTGNVGYRIIEANVRELLESPELKHSWC